MAPRLFLDMDGVLADFVGGFNDFFHYDLGKMGPPGEAPIAGYEWARLQKGWPTFWADLGYTPHAQELWRALAKYHPSILTAIPDSWPSAATGKTIWAKRMLPKFGYAPGQRVFAVKREEKRNFAQSGGSQNILVDDLARNISEWRGAGGLGIHYIPSGSAVARVVQLVEQHINGE